MTNRLDKLLSQNAEELLLRLGFSPVRLGWNYLLEAILAAAKLPRSQKLRICRYCRELAAQNHITAGAVERAMRTSIAKAYCANPSRFQETFPNLKTAVKKPTNSEFVQYCAYLVQKRL